MDTCNAEFSASPTLNEQIAQQLFDMLPERGPVLVIMDRRGHCWPSDAEAFARLNLSESLLGELRAKVDDGAEPVITQVGDTSVTLAQLATDRTNCGYVVIALPRHGPESTLTNIDLVEALLSQITLIARLIEKSSSLSQAQADRYSARAAGSN